MNTLSVTLTDNGDSQVMTLNHTQSIALFVEDTLGGGSVQPKISHDNVTWHNFGSAIAAVGVSKIDLPPCLFKATLAGATAPNAVITISRA